jgi:molecular chaperone DnaK
MKKEHGDKIDANEKEKIEAAIKKAREAHSKGSIDEIRKATDELTQCSHKLAEIMYKQAGQTQQGDETKNKAEDSTTDGGGAKKKDDNVVDADFEETK